jgi:hypothetical protein
MPKRTLRKKRGGNNTPSKSKSPTELKGFEVDNWDKYLELTPENEKNSSERLSGRLSEQVSPRESEYTKIKNESLDAEYAQQAKQIKAEEFRKKDVRDNLLKQANEENRQKLRNYLDEVKEGVKMDQAEETKEKIKRDWAVLDNKELTDEEFDLVYKELNNYLACDSKKKNYFSYFDNEEQKLCRKLKKSKKNRVPKTSLKGRFGNMYSSLFKRKSPQSQTNKGGRKHKTQRRRNRKH